MTDLGNGLLAIPVPEDANGYHFSNTTTKFLCFNSKCDAMSISLDCSTLDKFEILGTVTKDNISFDVETYVKTQKNAKRYLDYTAERKYFDYPEISFHSLLSSKGLFFENPLEYMKESCKGDWTGYEEMQECWQQAQNNLIEKLVIIKKV